MLAATKVKLEPGRLLIAGRWVETVKKFDSINPATAEVLTEISVASGEDVDRAVGAARHAFEDRNGAWRKLSAGTESKRPPQRPRPERDHPAKRSSRVQKASAATCW